MTLVEGESFDILVASGSGEGLEAWRRLHERWDYLTTEEQEDCSKKSFSLDVAKLVELQGSSGTMRLYTQRRDARNGTAPYVGRKTSGWRRWKRFFLRNSSDTANSNGLLLDTYQKLREEVVLYAGATGYVAPKLGQVSKAREARDDPMDVGGFGQWKGRSFSKGKGKNPTGTGKGKGAGKDGKKGAKSSGRANTQKIQGQCWTCGKNRSSI